ncbi:unnamed protein product, partial [Ectocarpus sp. 12 AP-2014]
MRVAGFGFRSGASVASLKDALAAAGGADGLNAIATAADKAQTLVFRSFALEMQLPVKFIAPSHIEAAQVTTHSAKSQTVRGTGSLSEAAALTAAGPDANLVAPRVISGDK